MVPKATFEVRDDKFFLKVDKESEGLQQHMAGTNELLCIRGLPKGVTVLWIWIK